MNNEEQKKLTKDQMKVIALRQRIGEITSNYEEMIADMRADFTEQVEGMQQVLQSQWQELQDLKGQANVQKKSDTEDASD